MKLLTLLFAALMLWTAAPAQAMTLTPIAAVGCNTASSSCTVNVSASVPAGSNIVLVAVTTAYDANTDFTAADNAATPNCGGAYATKIAYNAATGNDFVVATCMNTVGALTSGATCGASGTTQCGFTMTHATGSSNRWVLFAYAATGINTTTPFAGFGTVVSATWTSGAPLPTVPTSAPLAWSSEDAVGMIGNVTAASTDTMTGYTGGYVSLTSSVQGTVEMFLARQTLTTGTATLGATPTSSAARNYAAVVAMFVNSGATPLSSGQWRSLLGVGQ